MGIDPHIDIDFRSFDIETGDSLLLTTDGIHDFVNDITLKRLVVENFRQPEKTAQCYIAKSQARPKVMTISPRNYSMLIGLPNLDENEFYRELTDLPFPPPLESGMVLDGYQDTPGNSCQ